MRIAFHAPLKAPDHPVPSGDRAMARSLIAALRAGGHETEVVSTFRSFLSAPDAERMRAAEAEAQRESDRVAALWDAEGPPDLWFCYHPYYKAPDLLGPGLAARFGLAYAAAEASHAGKRARGPWAAWHHVNEAALRAADLQVCFTPRDAEGLAGLAARDRIAMLPPFIDAASLAEAARPPREAGPVRLLTVAMMRAGDKALSYAFLAEALGALPCGLDWRLTVVGDGPERDAVRSLFAALPAGRISWSGQCDAAGVAAAMARADLYVWPGFGEAYGMAYLEAGAAGLPTLAMDCGGIGSVVADGVTGVLTPEGDLPAFTSALARLATDHPERERLGAAARTMVRQDRTVERAAAILSSALGRMVEGRRSAAPSPASRRWRSDPAAVTRRRPATTRRSGADRMTSAWHPARDALDAAHAEGRRIEVWLRDDDCVAVTPALERLASLCGGVGLPILLAVIPRPAEDALAPWVAAQPGVTPCQHGFAHANHAPPGERARELGGRSVAAVLDDLERGRAKLRGAFGATLSDVLVPPWNRIDPEVIPCLSDLGFSALSCFAPTPDASPIPRLDSDLDIVDWRGGRVGRPLDDLARRIAGIIVARGDRLGLLTHHLAHDAVAWDALGTLLERLAEHPAVSFTGAAALLNRHGPATAAAALPRSIP